MHSKRSFSKRQAVRPLETVMVFGVFDGLHPGHRYFLRQAKRYSRKLIVAIARDSAVKKLKSKKPKENERDRLASVRKIREVSRAVLGDTQQGSYAVIKKYKPDIICLGYDQKRLGKDLKMRMRQGLVPKIRSVQLKAYQARRFKSSKINR